MTINIPADRPPIDPYPLSAYVAWAGKRNRDPILNVFKELFPPTGDVLELASGSGAHINYFAPHFKQISSSRPIMTPTSSRRSRIFAPSRATPMSQTRSRSTSRNRKPGPIRARSFMTSSS